MNAINIDDLRLSARRRLPKAIYDYVTGGAYGELTLHRNRTDLDALALNETVMRDVSTLSTVTKMAGDRASIPLALGPVGMAVPTIFTWATGGARMMRTAMPQTP